MTELRDIAASIESIGRNCEFGLIQRQKFGLERSGLLRWAGSADPHKLAMAFSERFGRLTDNMTGRPGPADQPPEKQNWLLLDDAYGVEFHTDEPCLKVSVEKAVERSRPRLRRLAELLLDGIAADERMFLYSDKDLFAADVEPLIAAFRSVGPATLLLVDANRAFPGGVSAWPGAKNVLLGCVPSLTRLNSAIDYHWDYWPQMLTRAYELWMRRLP